MPSLCKPLQPRQPRRRGHVLVGLTSGRHWGRGWGELLLTGRVEIHVRGPGCGVAGVSRVPFGKGLVEKGTRTWSLKGKRDVDTRKAESALFIFPCYLLR